MSKPIKKPQKRLKKRTNQKPAGMESLFPSLRPVAKRPAELKKMAADRAKLLLRIVDGFAAKGYLERGQVDRIKDESKRILMLLAKGRLTGKEAAYFLNMTNFVNKYLEI
ncbi:MAG: hypothetical protein N3F05_02095 [Candidatus Diapherotrites archaeon]|nr:hypothetical protein [Candidatus Diapherotrites archaeon]